MTWPFDSIAAIKGRLWSPAFDGTLFVEMADFPDSRTVTVRACPEGHVHMEYDVCAPYVDIVVGFLIAVALARKLNSKRAFLHELEAVWLDVEDLISEGFREPLYDYLRRRGTRDSNSWLH